MVHIYDNCDPRRRHKFDELYSRCRQFKRPTNFLPPRQQCNNNYIILLYCTVCPYVAVRDIKIYNLLIMAIL